MYNILVALPLKPEDKDMFVSAAQGHSITFKPAAEVVRADVEDKDIIIGNIADALLSDLPRLKWMQLDSAGSDSFAKLPLFSCQGAALLTNASGAYGVTIAEYMIGSIIMLLRRFHIYRDQMHEHLWQKEIYPDTISGSKTLIAGLGDIGNNLAIRMNALGSEVTALKRRPADAPDYLKAIYTLDKLPAVLSDKDFVCTCLPQSPETRKIFNKETFGLMKKGAIFVNVGRGTAVDSDALAEALSSGHLAGAALDVTDPEPLPADHPLWDCKNCFITPHVAGLSLQRDPYEKINIISTDNLCRFLTGEPLKNLVDLTTGYRAKTVL